MKTIDSKVLLNKQLKNSEFKKHYDEYEKEFDIAREVIRFRQKMKLTQKELAVKVGTSQPAIARLESGQYKNVSLSFLRKVGKVFNAVPEVHFKVVRKIG